MCEQLLSGRETLQAYSSVYYVGTIIPIAVILFGMIVKPPRGNSKTKTKKAE
jgi:lysophospholipid acyltransferase